MALEFNKRIFTTGEFYRIMKDAFKSMGKLKSARKVLDENFSHRIMLCVSEVNGCKACSYFHTELALKDGMSDGEITSLLSGNLENVPPNEGVGLFFAQHYADKKGKYDEKAWERVVEDYGSEKAEAILASTRMIMMGNAYGIAYGCLLSRFKCKPVKGSRLSNELGILLGSVVLMPAALVSSLIYKARGK